MKHWIWPFLLVAACGTASAEEAMTELEQALVGRRVMIPFDVPVSSYGVDFDGDREFARDDKSRFDRLDKWGMSLRGGDIATITEVRVSKRSIELLLDRGGLSTTELMRLKDPKFSVGGTAVLPQDTGPHSTNPESRRAELGRIMISDEGRSASRAEDARFKRTESDTAGQARARQLSTRAYVYRPGLGSRLRILFKKDVPEELLEPRTLMIALAEHVMFVREESEKPQASPDSAAVGAETH
jgi:hypothetical protein